MNKLTTLLFLTHCVLAQAQELSHVVYTVKDGLPGSNVYQCLQDHSGFIWFCTNQGVSRFDGKTFRNFSEEDGLPDNEILKLYLDAYGDVWFISLKGIPSVYYHGTIHRLDTCKNVYAVTEDLRTGDLLMLTVHDVGGIYRVGYYKSPDIPGHWTFSESLKDPVRCSLLRASTPAKTDFYFSTDAWGIHRLGIEDRNGQKAWYSFYDRPALMYLPYDMKSFFTLTPDPHSIIFATDTVYIASGSGLRRLFALRDLRMNRGDLSDMYCENDSTLWICSRNRGLILVHNFLRENRTLRTYFPKTFCTCIRKDREGGYWVTTHDDGVFYLPSLEVGCVGVEPKDVKCIQALDNSTLVSGLAQGNTVLIHTRPTLSSSFLRWDGDGGNNRILDIKPYGKNMLVVAGDQGVHLISRAGFNLVLDSTPSAKGLYCLPDSDILFSAAEGMYQVNPFKRRSHRVFDYRCTCVGGIGNDYFWGTMEGMYSQIGATVRYWGSLTPALAGIINHIDIAPDSTIWVSTQQGIVLLKNGRPFIIGKHQGLPSDLCKHVFVKDNTAWVSTDKGVSRITLHWNGLHPVIQISNITEDDGLISNDVNQTTALNGYVWAATARGISYFPENYIPHSMADPLINISTPNTDTLVVDYRNNKLSIGLSGISFRSGKHITYQYRLKDLDTDWITTATDLIEFSTLPFGTHTFEVRVIDRWGTVGHRVKRLSILVPPPFWRTSWFTALTYLLTALLIGIAVTAYIKVHHRKRDGALKQQNKMADLEMRALRSQMDPHFIFNCLSSIQYYILDADIKNANLYLYKLSDLIRRILQHCAKSYITLAEELSILQLYMELEKLRLSERMEYSIEVGEDLLPTNIQIPSLLIQPFVENSIKHGISPLQGKKGMVRVVFKRSGKYLVCTIDDNGVGIHASRNAPRMVEHASVGISNIEHRIRIINMMRKEGIALKITDKSETGPDTQGTIAQIHFLL